MIEADDGKTIYKEKAWMKLEQFWSSGGFL
jgi:hypothetical protein